MVNPGGMGFPGVSNDFVIDGDLVIRDGQDRVRLRLDSATGNIFVFDENSNLIFLLEAIEGNLRLKGAPNRSQDGDLLIFPRQADNIRDDNQATLHFNGDQGVLSVGGNSIPGGVLCRDGERNQTILLDGDGTARIGANGRNGNLFMQTGENVATIHLNSNGGTNGGFAVIRAGGRDSSGSIQLYPAGATDLDNSNHASVLLSAVSGSLSLGGGIDGANGRIFMLNSSNASAVRIDADESRIRVGGGGRLSLFPSSRSASSSIEEATVNISAESGSLRVGGGIGSTNSAGELINGTVTVRSQFNFDTISLAGENAALRAGGNNSSGQISLHPAASTDMTQNDQASIRLNAATGGIRVGGGTHGIGGDVAVRNSSNQTTIALDGQESRITLSNNDQETIRFDGEGGNITLRGDIVLEGGDCAEDFEIAIDTEATPGSVMVTDHSGKLRLSDRAYDRRVVGIIAGAGSLRPGIVLGRNAASRNCVPIALTGKVYCKVDASVAPIEVGDLLTTSDRPGFAMKAANAAQAFGATIGKAMGSLDRGTGMIPVLVALQ